MDGRSPGSSVLIRTLGRQSPDFFDRRADIQKALRVQDQKPEALAALLGQLPETLFALAKLRFRRPAPAKFLGSLQGAQDRGGEPYKPLFEQIIGCAVLQALDGSLLAQGSGNQQNRRYGLFLLRQFQG